MATQDDVAGQNLEKLNENLAKVEQLSQRLIQALAARNPANPTLNGPNQELFAKAAKSYWAEAVENPGKIYEQQLEYWGKSVRHFLEAQQVMLRGEPVAEEAEPDPLAGDKRFSNPLWNTHPYFRYIKQQYALNAQAIENAVGDVEDLPPKDKRRLDYFAHQIIDMMSPTNFLGTNPDALERAVATEGESLVKGLENLIADLEANSGELVVRLADDKAFKLGENIGTTQGEVVYRNRMMELIQYSPTTEQVHEIPVVIFPPWINKFYILDLKPDNSMIKWVVDQGYTLFVVSWVNADTSHAEVGMEDYIEEGFLTAIREAKAITGQKEVNAVGYCIAGTTLHMTLALMAKRGDKSVKSATFFTALTDFSEQGEFTPFLQDDFIDGIEDEVTQQGVLRSFIMGRTMSFLRSRDLIYQPAVRSYMMGEAPPAFDLLYWNGDGANLPGKMTVQYLRGLCQGNHFVTDGFEICGERLHIRDVKVPLMSITCETDHIAAWKDCYRGFQQTGAKDRTFIVSESGHIAGIVNPPTKKKYGHYTNPDLSADAEAWMEGAEYTAGSWWPRWESWLAKRSGKMISAREPGDSEHPALAPAPGTYVRKKATL
ncbi:poly(3-hydroxyalkanoate) polymerase [Roseovarius sp. TM1035]|jgi:polyhydroxyalkanoate synthase|uniref:Poly-beta-hydroxybutyrate polymerase n=1 Tax=Roseovarius mucosus TaxID=215743 RepID=A0A1V0RR64_9RHOB|nr:MULTISPECIES: class I poly(R)-hydroxyalkanoic acid synthase [Roseovarius]ARE84267.1 poly-beta-hydroxybutyrate polymerase [Roseovarius mucosus]AWZ19055.1 Polyhydroxyalkanoic acid synthase [Roseovarius sp. AK1035]EDM33227.1 poly(3-hydroxyalkanoate) polymerase [Roseovarius sp. TM1035]MBW4973403.1 class I poly(R)-hydroxyalkanoic acid synthase [Roseovarius mucosus]|tara:strand:+ start:691 stop:2493 length:1803 start_codon:yes stop_codon:yes gene_type:complete